MQSLGILVSVYFYSQSLPSHCVHQSINTNNPLIVIQLNKTSFSPFNNGHVCLILLPLTQIIDHSMEQMKNSTRLNKRIVQEKKESFKGHQNILKDLQNIFRGRCSILGAAWICTDEMHITYVFMSINRQVLQ